MTHTVIQCEAAKCPTRNVGGGDSKRSVNVRLTPKEAKEDVAHGWGFFPHWPSKLQLLLHSVLADAPVVIKRTRRIVHLHGQQTCSVHELALWVYMTRAKTLVFRL